MRRRVPKPPRGSVALEHVLLFGIALPLAIALFTLAVRALAAWEHFVVDAVTGPLP